MGKGHLFAVAVAGYLKGDELKTIRVGADRLGKSRKGFSSALMVLVGIYFIFQGIRY